jgi:hypothetical protein
MNEKQILEFCLTHGITVKQFFIVYTTSRRWKGYAQEALQFFKSEPWTEDEVRDLLEKKILISSDGSCYYLSLKVNSEFSQSGLQDQEMGEELWQAYPATFPLTGGGNFNARTTKGLGKEVIISEYLKRIGNKPEKHLQVMKVLPRYIKMVQAGKINGHSITDFIKDEMWDTITEPMETEFKPKFGTDI